MTAAHSIAGWMRFLGAEYIACFLVGVLVIALGIGLCYLVGAVILRVSHGQWPWPSQEDQVHVILIGVSVVCGILVATVIGLEICKNFKGGIST